MHPSSSGRNAGKTGGLLRGSFYELPEGVRDAEIWDVRGVRGSPSGVNFGVSATLGSLGIPYAEVGVKRGAVLSRTEHVRPRAPRGSSGGVGAHAGRRLRS